MAPRTKSVVLCSEFAELASLRDGKTLQNSTDKSLSLKNYQTKYVQKKIKIVQKRAKMSQIVQKMQKLLKT